MNLKTDCTFGVMKPGQRYTDRVGSYLIAERDGSIALIRTPKGYFLPGGGMEEGEGLEDCLHREILEELGCTVRIDRPLGAADMYGWHEKIGWFHPIQHYFCGELIRKVAAPVEEDHTLVWLPLSEAEKLLFTECQRWAVGRCIKR